MEKLPETLLMGALKGMLGSPQAQEVEKQLEILGPRLWYRKLHREEGARGPVTLPPFSPLPNLLAVLWALGQELRGSDPQGAQL
jgi:hypothetical protein